MVLRVESLGLMDQSLNVGSELLSFSQGGVDALVLDQLSAHCFDERLAVLGAPTELTELKPVSHIDFDGCN